MADYMHSSSRRAKATKHVFIAIPTYGDIPAKAVHTLLIAKDWLISHDVSVDVMILAGNCHVDDARNDLVRRFLETECTDLIFIDADVIYTPSAIGQLLSHNVDIVGGAYPYKDKSEEFPIVYLPGQDVKAEKGLIGVAGIPTGFLRISRRAIEAAYKEAAKKGTWKVKGLGTSKFPMAEVFYRGVASAGDTLVRRSGDYQFCHDICKMGFSVFCDPNLTLGHLGLAQSVGNFGRTLMEPHFHEILPEYIKYLREPGNNSDGAIEYIADAFGNKPWAAGPVLLKALWMLAARPDVTRILEAGAGVSTVVMAATGKYIMSLEADQNWLAKTSHFLRQCGLIGDVRFAPLKANGHGTWYDYHEGGFRPDLIFIDGPVRTSAGVRGRMLDVIPNIVRGARYIVVDDVDDADGMSVVQRLHDEFGFSFEVVPDPTRRAFAILER